MERVIDRLLTFIRYLKESGNGTKSAKAFEEKCGLSNSYIANVKKGNGSVGSDMLAKINLAFPQLNLEWLCSGNGEMLKQEMVFFSEILGNRNVSLEIVKDNSMFPVFEQGNTVAINMDIESEIICGQIYAIYMQDNSVFFRYISMFDKNKVVLVPANKEPQYGSEQELSRKKIKKISRVVGVVKTFV